MREPGEENREHQEKKRQPGEKNKRARREKQKRARREPESARESQRAPETVKERRFPLHCCAGGGKRFDALDVVVVAGGLCLEIREEFEEGIASPVCLSQGRRIPQNVENDIGKLKALGLSWGRCWGVCFKGLIFFWGGGYAGAAWAHFRAILGPT